LARITDKGARSFIFMYFKAGKRHRITIGRVGEIDLDEAREQARQLRAQVRAGKPIENRPPATAATFRDVVDLYTKPGPRRQTQREHHTSNHQSGTDGGLGEQTDRVHQQGRRA
jgi:hypothetical protein